MNDKQNDQHEKTKKKLKIVGISLIVIGTVFSLIGFIDFFSAFSGYRMPNKFWCLFIGFPTFGIGLIITNTAYKREISRYMKNESTPVINEASDDLAPAFRNVASAVKEGLSNTKISGIRCSCGELNEKGDKFCSACGKALLSTCPHCGKEVDVDDRFCGQCGEKL